MDNIKKVSFSEDKNSIKYYKLDLYEKYSKKVTWQIIKFKSNNIDLWSIIKSGKKINSKQLFLE